MSSTPKNFVADKDTILKEGWFKKRNFKGELGRGYSKRWCVLTNRYFEWFDCPNGARKQTIPLDHAHARIHEGTGLIVGSYQTGKEWLLRDEGATPAVTVAEWLDCIHKAIENFRNVSGSAAASAPGQKGLVNLADVLANNQQNQAQASGQQARAMASHGSLGGVPTATVTHTPSPQPPPVNNMVMNTQYNVPAPMATVAPPPPVHTNYGYTPAAMPQTTTTTTYNIAPAPATTMYTTAYQQPVFQPTYIAPAATTTYVQQTPMIQTTYMQPQMTYVQPTTIVTQPTMTYTTYNPMF